MAKLQRKLPVLGNIDELNSASQYANTMAMMLEAGLPISRAVAITSKVLDNYYVSQSVGKITGSLEEGNTLGASLREANECGGIYGDWSRRHLRNCHQVGEVGGVHPLIIVNDLHPYHGNHRVSATKAK
jgi:type II secretory pathway component PulF